MWTEQIDKYRDVVGSHSSYCGERRYKLRTGRGGEEPSDTGFESVISEWTVSTERAWQQ